MWHEARKQERLIRGMIVDYRRRAERRKDFYEKIKAEPTQFLQLHGRPCKIHLDPAVAAAGEGPAIMMPWQGDNNNLIDRFDVRAHLDYIPEVKNPDIPPSELSQEERQCNYERYRILAQNAFLGISEDKFLQQLAIEEQFGVTIEEKEMQKEKLLEKKGSGAAIGYNYNDPGAQPSCSNGPELKKVESKDSDDDSDLEIIDVDLSIDVNKMAAAEAHELNAVGPQFGMAGCDLFSFLTGDADDAEHQKQLLREEKEKAMFSGRKSRRERRAHRDKKLASRVMSPPSYAARSPRSPRSPRSSRSPRGGRSPRSPRSPRSSRERSASPAPAAIQFITSFGPEDETTPTPQKPLYADKVKLNLKKKISYSDAVQKQRNRSHHRSGHITAELQYPYRSSSRDRAGPPIGPRLPHSRSRSRSKSKSYSRSRSRSPYWHKSRSRSRSVSRSRSRSRSRSSRSRSRSYSPCRRAMSRSRSRSRNQKGRRSRSPNNASSGRANRSRSMSYESNDKNSSQPKAPVPRYYGRRKEDKSSSELSALSDSDDSGDDSNKSAVGNSNQNQLRLSGSSSKGLSRETLTLKEKLRRKMQAQLSKQLRADKRAEAARLERESRRQARRDEEMRHLAIKLRRKQREMRHMQSRRSSEEDSEGSFSGSSHRQSPEPDKPGSSQSFRKTRENRSKSKSPSSSRPVPVWETSRDHSPPHRSKPFEDTRRKYEDTDYRAEGRYEDRPQYHSNRYERYPRHEGRDYAPRSYDYGRGSQYDNRWEQDRNYSGPRRRPYGGYRGGGHYRGNYRQSYQQGPSNWQNSPQDDDRPTSSKVKLVDY